jgi:formylglycine-generating enzyme required for sulfatase activity
MKSVRRIVSFCAAFAVAPILPAQGESGSASRPGAQDTRPAAAGAASRPAGDAKPFKFVLPGSVWTASFVPLPPASVGGKTLWMMTTEVPWDAYDAFVFATDLEEGAADLDGVTRPSRPYIPPDRGLGHAGYPTISVSFRGADFFGVWLTKRAGGKFRLPTEAEFEAAALAGATGKWCTGDDAAKLLDYAWTKDSSLVDGKPVPHPIGSKKANAWGLFDLHGNVAEWCVGPDGRGVTKGGHYEDGADDVAVKARRPLDKAWQKTDPQVPKSKWWLTDGPFVGFRVVCETLPTNVKIES